MVKARGTIEKGAGVETSKAVWESGHIPVCGSSVFRPCYTPALLLYID